LSQLAFSFQNSSTSDLYKEEDFLFLEENFSVVNFLKKFFEQKNFSIAQFPSLIVKGPKASGKTHLLHIFAKKFNAQFLDKEKLSEVNPVKFFVPGQFYILDNVNEIKDDELVLRLINSAFEAKAFLILGLSPNSQFQLKDLTSRLKNIFAVEIKNPNQETIKHLLVNGFARKQIKLSGKIIDLIADNVERNYEAILAVIEKVESYGREKGKNLTVKEIEGIVF